MIFLRLIYRYVLFISFIFFPVSCVKDIDFSQAKEISLQPKAQIDLVNFEIGEEDWVDSETKQQKVIIRDTVRLAFLDDDYIQKNLTKLELSFRNTSSLSQAVFNRITFLSENNREEYRVDLFTEAASQQNPLVTETVRLIDAGEVDAIKRSIKMALEIERVPNSRPLTGGLKFESKGLLFFEF